jgi:hypothetical protein
VVQMAGQIPLIPNSMTLSAESFFAQAVLSLQHLWRVGQERQVDVWMVGVAFVPVSTLTERHADIAVEVWHMAHQMRTAVAGIEDESESEEVDVWDRMNNRGSASLGTNVQPPGNHLHPLPGLSSISDRSPPCVVAEVQELPMSASIEWWSTGLGGLATLDGEGAITTQLRSLAAGLLLYSANFEGTNSDNGSSVGLLTLVVPESYSTGKNAATDLGAWMAHNLSSAEDDGHWERKIVNGHILTAGERGSQIFEQLADKPALAGVAHITCSRLYISNFGDSKDLTEPSKTPALAVISLRIEQCLKTGP